MVNIRKEELAVGTRADWGFERHALRTRMSAAVGGGWPDMDRDKRRHQKGNSGEWEETSFNTQVVDGDRNEKMEACEASKREQRKGEAFLYRALRYVTWAQKAHGD